MTNKMRPQLAAVLLLSLAFSVSGCASGGPSDEPVYQQCRCGTPEHDVLGCTATCCAQGHHDCDNTRCPCIATNSHKAPEPRK